MGKIVSLYNLCKVFKKLPHSGGINNQPAIWMDYFSVIEQQLSKNRELKASESNARSVAAQLGRGKHG